ncbi:MAG: hypothetical protein ACTSVI_09115 [Promethearchaeota archaeon]
MIYQLLLIDADSGILIFDKVFKILKKPKAQKDLRSGVIAEFFTAINGFIDEIQAAMRKGREVSNMNRTLLAENSTMTLVYQPEARVLISTISDADDDTEILIAVCRKIGERFWKKHRKNLQLFREKMEREQFKSFIPDIELILHDGKIAEIFPKLQINLKTLRRITIMGIISEQDYQVANMINGKTSPFQIAKKLKISKNEVMNILQKLEDLDIIEKLKVPKI